MKTNLLKPLIEGISYKNAKEYFGFNNYADIYPLQGEKETGGYLQI